MLLAMTVDNTLPYPGLHCGKPGSLPMMGFACLDAKHNEIWGRVHLGAGRQSSGGSLVVVVNDLHSYRWSRTESGRGLVLRSLRTTSHIELHTEKRMARGTIEMVMKNFELIYKRNLHRRRAPSPASSEFAPPVSTSQSIQVMSPDDVRIFRSFMQGCRYRRR